MKIWIASDLHGSETFTRQLLDRFDSEGGDRLVLLGDLYYHGVRNPLPEGYAPLEVNKLLNSVREKLLVVRGNCDSEVDLTVSEFPVVPAAIVIADGIQIYLCHGHRESFDCLPPLTRGSVFCQGHTHVSSLSERDGICLLNPGSVSLPKGGTKRGFAVIEDGIPRLETLSD